MSLKSPLTIDIPIKPREIGVMFANLRFLPGICTCLSWRSSDADEPCWASHCGRQVPLLLQTVHPPFSGDSMSVFLLTLLKLSTTIDHY